MKDHDIEELLWRALESKLGIEVATNDVEAFKRRLYSSRAKARQDGNLAFDSLQFITPPAESDTKLWIVRNNGN